MKVSNHSILTGCALLLAVLSTPVVGENIFSGIRGSVERSMPKLPTFTGLRKAGVDIEDQRITEMVAQGGNGVPPKIPTPLTSKRTSSSSLESLGKPPTTPGLGKADAGAAWSLPITPEEFKSKQLTQPKVLATKGGPPVSLAQSKGILGTEIEFPKVLRARLYTDGGCEVAMEGGSGVFKIDRDGFPVKDGFGQKGVKDMIENSVSGKVIGGMSFEETVEGQMIKIEVTKDGLVTQKMDGETLKFWVDKDGENWGRVRQGGPVTVESADGSFVMTLKGRNRLMYSKEEGKLVKMNASGMPMKVGADDFFRSGLDGDVLKLFPGKEVVSGPFQGVVTKHDLDQALEKNPEYTQVPGAGVDASAGQSMMVVSPNDESTIFTWDKYELIKKAEYSPPERVSFQGWPSENPPSVPETEPLWSWVKAPLNPPPLHLKPLIQHLPKPEPFLKRKFPELSSAEWPSSMKRKISRLSSMESLSVKQSKLLEFSSAKWSTVKQRFSQLSSRTTVV